MASLKQALMISALALSLGILPGPAWAKEQAKEPLPKAPVVDAATLEKLKPETREGLKKLYEALHTEDRVIYNELRDEQELSLSNIGMLWQAAVERSGTIRFAIEKLSRRDATGKPVEGDNFNKKMISSLANIAGVAGAMWTGSPASLIGSNMVGDLMSGNPHDSALSRVTDADMVILAKEVEALQSQVIEAYYTYQHAKERLELAQQASNNIAKYYDHAEELATTSEALKPLMASIYETARQDEQNAVQELASAKTALSLLVGPDAVMALEQGPAKSSSAK